MTVTYRGVSQFAIAEGIERLALLLITLDIGPQTTETAEAWLAPDGTAAAIRTATDKTEILKALAAPVNKQGYSTISRLGDLFNNLLPAVYFKGTDADVKQELGHVVQEIMRWDGFLMQTGRFSVYTALDKEMDDYRMEKLGMERFDGISFNLATIPTRPFTTYQVYAVGNTGDTMDDIRDFAESRNREDEISGSHDGTITMTPDLAHLILAHVDSVQALGLNGKLLTRSLGDTLANRLDRFFKK